MGVLLIHHVMIARLLLFLLGTILCVSACSPILYTPLGIELLFAVLALLALGHAFAQTTSIPVEPSLRQQLHHIFGPLDKSQTATSLFFDQALPLVAPSRYRGGTRLKTLTFTLKTQKRRRRPQPQPLTRGTRWSLRLYPPLRWERGWG